mgnify:CR=1 FL=1
MISISENSAQLIRPAPVVFPQGPASLPLVEASVARLLDLNDGQVVQGTVQSQGEQLALLLRGRLLALTPGMEWTVGQRLNLRAQRHADGSLTLNRLPTPAQGPPAPGRAAGAPAAGGAPDLPAAAGLGSARTAQALPGGVPGSSANPLTAPRSLYAGPPPPDPGNVALPMAAAMARSLQLEPAQAGAVAQQQLASGQPVGAGGGVRRPAAAGVAPGAARESGAARSAYAPPLVALDPLPAADQPLPAPAVAQVDAPTVQAMGLRDGQVLQASVQARDGALGFVVDGRLLPTLEPGAQDDPLLVNLRVQIHEDGSATLHNLLAPAPRPAPAAAPLALAPVSLGGVLATVAEDAPP